MNELPARESLDHARGSGIADSDRQQVTVDPHQGFRRAADDTCNALELGVRQLAAFASHDSLAKASDDARECGLSRHDCVECAQIEARDQRALGRAQIYTRAQGKSVQAYGREQQRQRITKRDVLCDASRTPDEHPAQASRGHVVGEGAHVQRGRCRGCWSRFWRRRASRTGQSAIEGAGKERNREGKKRDVHDVRARERKDRGESIVFAAPRCG